MPDNGFGTGQPQSNEVISFGTSASNMHGLNISNTSSREHRVGYLYRNAGGSAIQLVEGANNSFPFRTETKIACGYTADDSGTASVSISVDGATVLTGSSATATIPVNCNTMWIMYALVSGPTKEFFYYNTRESDAQLVTLTGG